MDTSTNVLKKYFNLVEKLCCLWESLPKKVNKPLSSMETLSEQLLAASSINHEMGIGEKFPGLEERIIFKTLMALEHEHTSISIVVQEVGETTEKINKLALLIGSEMQPKFFTSSILSSSSLLEAVSDSKQYYQALYLGVLVALNSLDFRDSQSIKNLRKSFTEDKVLKKNAQRKYGSFMSL